MLTFLAIDWNLEIPTPTGGGGKGGTRLAELMRRLRLPKPPKVIYRTLLIAIKINDSEESEIIPLGLESWRSILIRFNLHEPVQFQDRVIIIHRLVSLLMRAPNDLARMEPGRIRNLPGEDPNIRHIVKLRQAPCIATTPTWNSSGSSINLATDSGLLARSVRQKDIDNALITNHCNRLAAESPFPITLKISGTPRRLSYLHMPIFLLLRWMNILALAYR